MPQSSVLVLSTDSLLAALLGALIETLGLRPVFAPAGERPRETLLRHRPRAVLLDCGHTDACDESFLGPATMTGTRVIVFGRESQRSLLERFATKHSIRHLVIPARPERLTDLIREALDVDIAS